MTSRLVLACVLAAASLCLGSCDRMQPQDAVLANAPEFCANSTTGPDLSAERAVEARSLVTHADTAKRDRDTLTLSYAGKTIATVKGCDSFYTGSIRLLDPKSNAIEAYDVFMTGLNQSIVVDHDGTAVLFEGTLVASPDGRHIASGEAYQSSLNAELTITDWASAGRAQVAFPVTCTPKSWTAAGLNVDCDRSDTSDFFSDATVTPAADGWVLRETKLNPLPNTPRDVRAARARETLQTYVSEIVWPEDNPDWIDAGVYRPLKGAAIPLHLADRSLALADPATGKRLTYPLTMSDSSFGYRLSLDETVAYDLGSRPAASPDGRFIATFDLDTLLADWSRKVAINFDDVYCVDGKWVSADELQAWCYGADYTVAHYVEARITKAANGMWTYREIGPARKTVDHHWQPYKAKGFVPRHVGGRDGREMLNEIPPPRIIA